MNMYQTNGGKKLETVHVKITGIPGPTAWYADSVGEVFEVYKDRRNYIVKEDYDAGDHVIWRLISFANSVEVDPPEEETP